MENFGGFEFTDTGKTARKKRSNLARRPRNDSQPLIDCRDNSSPSTQPSDNVSRASSDENNGAGSNSWKKERNLIQCTSRASSTNLVEVDTTSEINREDIGGRVSNEGHIVSNREQDSKRCSEGVLAPSNWKSATNARKDLELQSRIIDTQISRKISAGYSFGLPGQSEVASDGRGSDNKVRKVKLKVGGATRTIHANSTSVGASVGGSSSTKSSRSSDAPRPRQKLILQDTSDDDHSSSPEKESGLQGVPWKDYSRSGFSVMSANSLRGKKPEESVSSKQPDKSEPVRKSKRIPKKRLLDGAFDDEDDDGELRYLEKLKISKVANDYSAEYEDDEEVGNRKKHKISKVMKRKVDGRSNVDAGDYSSSRSGKEVKKFKSEKASEDTDYDEEEELVSDGEPETKRKKQKKELADLLGDSKRESAITTRQRALQTVKDISSKSGASLVEFPNGLPPAPPRKQKEKLSEVEQQLKKAEAAQRRRMQVEKAARESEAEAIRKILGQDSNRKKREDKMKKRQEELAQERATNAMTLSQDTVRWVNGPTGSVVTFPNEMGLPSIFEPKGCSYPPPREKCAGPACTNPYKYRDSKWKLPLCSLQCYKAIHGEMQHWTAC
ncbi:INO80 complex subunit B like [Actinidia chinensis var. chinensis]|uniref:INO80 complex subunit B like n=1 Tax=Actinidia chinensis var. chinensis TaxID=1590841 RepID=A0A2R6Q728_ACTCC|nr:INO80 complex subunit B like [Actinidia chinensis var. chinensis]